MPIEELSPIAAQQRANMDVIFNPGKKVSKDPSQRHTNAMRATLEKQIKATGSDQPVTLLNLNPTTLQINGGMFHPEVIPACPLDQPYVVYVFRETRWGHKDSGVGLDNVHRIDPFPEIPKRLAAEYMRQYQQEGDGYGGVICYIGDHHPSTIKKGHMVTVPVVTFADGELVMDEQERDFHEMLAMVRGKRNQSLLRDVQQSNAWYENDEQRKNVNDSHREKARMALREKLIPALPRWCLDDSSLTEKHADPCPVCRVVPLAGSIMCVNCNYILDVVETYRLRPSECAYGSAEMDRLTAEQWVIVNKIKADRDKVRGAKAQ